MYSWICIRICTAGGFMGTGLRRRAFPADGNPENSDGFGGQFWGCLTHYSEIYKHILPTSSNPAN